jgi:hypothetical protein
MTFYEKLVKKMSQSMRQHPHSPMVIDVNTFQIIARSRDLKSLSKKLPRGGKAPATVVFQKPHPKPAWIL